MNQDTLLLVTDKGSIILPNGNLATPGMQVRAGEFAKHQENLATLLREGNLSERLDQPVNQIDVERVPSPGLPIAGKDSEGLDANKTARVVAGSANDAATIARLAEIKAAQEAAKKAEAERQSLMADVEGQPMTAEEAQALGLINKPQA